MSYQFYTQEKDFSNSFNQSLSNQYDSLNNMATEEVDTYKQIAQSKLDDAKVAGTEYLVGGLASITPIIDTGKNIYNLGSGLYNNAGKVLDSINKVQQQGLDMINSSKNSLLNNFGEYKNTQFDRLQPLKDQIADVKSQLQDTNLSAEAETGLNTQLNTLQSQAKDMYSDIQNNLVEWKNTNLGELQTVQSPVSTSRFTGRENVSAEGDPEAGINFSALENNSIMGSTKIAQPITSSMNYIGEGTSKVGISGSSFISGEGETSISGLTRSTDLLSSVIPDVGVDVGEGLIAGLEVPAVGELVGAGLGVYALVKGIESLFESAPKIVLPNIPQQEEIQSTAQSGI